MVFRLAVLPCLMETAAVSMMMIIDNHDSDDTNDDVPGDPHLPPPAGPPLDLGGHAGVRPGGCQPRSGRVLPPLAAGPGLWGCKGETAQIPGLSSPYHCTCRVSPAW